jgi:O-antigen/teichoic acid export membrane protein
MGPAVTPAPLHLGRGLKEMGADVAVLGLFSVICFLDVFVIKHRLDDSSAAMYSRAALVAKSFLYLASALNMVLLPAVSSARAKGGEAQAKKALLKFVAAALGIDLLGLLFVWIFTPLSIRILLGPNPDFQSLAPLIRIFSVAVVPLALSQLVIYYLVAARDYRVLWLVLIAAGLYALLLQTGASEASHVVLSLGSVASALFVTTLGLALVPSRKKLVI